MKIVHITNAGGYGRVQDGGAERAVAELSSVLADDHGWDEAVIAPPEFFAGRAISASVDQLTVPLEAFGLRRSLDPRGPLRRRLRDRRPDVVMTHLLRGTLVGLPAARAVGAATVSVLHNSIDDYADGAPGVRHRVNAAAFGLVGGRWADAHVAISDANAADLVAHRRMRPERVHRIYNWVSDAFSPGDARPAGARLRAALGLAGDVPVVALVGRLEEQKRPAFMIELLPDLPGVTLLVAGDGALRGACEALAERLGVADRVRFLGFRRDVATVLAAADVVAVPSAFEGFGRVAAEALAVGTPVVGSDIPGLAEVLRPAPPGTTRTVAVDDRPGWIAALGAMLRSPYAAAGDPAAVAYVRSTFSLRQAGEAYDRLLRDLVRARGTNAASTDGAAGPS